MQVRDIIVIGASAGGVESLQQLLPQLSVDFEGSVFIVNHLSPDHLSHLAEILQRACALPVNQANDGEPILPGHVYVAVPDRHLLLEDGCTRLSVGPKENRFRPAVDVLFRSAAWSYGPRVIGVVLSGAMDDGSSGLIAIKQCGGLAIVQDPIEAFCSGMPENAIRYAQVDHVLQIHQMSEMLQKQQRLTVPDIGEISIPSTIDSEIRIAMGEKERINALVALGELTPFTCPDCNGPLVKILEGRLTRFRCRTGHAFTLNHLLSEMIQQSDAAIMTALRSLEETELLLTDTQEQLRDSNLHRAANQLHEKVKQVKRQAALVKKAAKGNVVTTLDPVGED